MNIRTSRIRLLCSIALLCSTLLACGRTPAPRATVEMWYGVDPIFQEYYKFLGKNTVMGLPISPAFQEGNKTVQYLETGKMVFDPSAPIRRRFTLAPLCKLFGLAEPPLPPPPSHTSSRYIDGHYIAPEFLPLYEQLLPENVGKPITEIRLNETYKRHEQFFENLAFYRLEGSNEIRLLPIGAWACGSDCRSSNLLKNAGIDIYPQIDLAFTRFVDKMGADFTGYAMAKASYNREGRWEQAFEKVVLITDSPGGSGIVRLRSLPKDLNVRVEQPRPYKNTPNTYFYEILNGKGYEIPDYFWAYITRHGGLEISGTPITHPARLTSSVIHQCFEHICLMYDARLPLEARVRPESLGYTYKLLYYAEIATATPAPVDPILRVWERYPVASSNQRQEVGVIVLKQNQPIAGVAPFMTLTLPSGDQKTLAMPITDTTGRSSLLLPLIRAINGTLILYQVCIPSFGDQSCVGDSFVIWNIP
jgi:hypothetical protein